MLRYIQLLLSDHIFKAYNMFLFDNIANIIFIVNFTSKIHTQSYHSILLLTLWLSQLINC